MFKLTIITEHVQITSLPKVDTLCEVPLIKLNLKILTDTFFDEYFIFIRAGNLTLGFSSLLQTKYLKYSL